MKNILTALCLMSFSLSFACPDYQAKSFGPFHVQRYYGLTRNEYGVSFSIASNPDSFKGAQDDFNIAAGISSQNMTPGFSIGCLPLNEGFGITLQALGLGIYVHCSKRVFWSSLAAYGLYKLHQSQHANADNII